MNLLWDARSKWYMIGIELGLDVDELDAIEANSHHRTDECLSKMLHSWLRQAIPRPTWSKLVEALRSRSIGYTNMAEELSAMSGGVTSPKGRN